MFLLFNNVFFPADDDDDDVQFENLNNKDAKPSSNLCNIKIAALVSMHICSPSEQTPVNMSRL